MYYDPKTDIYPYPKYTDRHYLVVKKNDGSVFDENYPFVDNSEKFRVKRFFSRILLNVIVFPLAVVRLGLKVKGKENLKKHKRALESGVISCSNHVHMWDYLAVMKTVRPRKPFVLAWAPNVRGESGKLVRVVGGIPIPDEGVRATKAFVRSVNDLLSKGEWLHIYAEGSMWEYYAPIRPFKRGIGYFACRTDKPVLPMAFSYRKPGWIRRKIFGQTACFTLSVGEPLYADNSMPIKERETDIIKRCHRAVCVLAGVDPDKNVYPPVFDNTERIDYYTTVYGKNSKQERR